MDDLPSVGQTDSERFERAFEDSLRLDRAMAVDTDYPELVENLLKRIVDTRINVGVKISVRESERGGYSLIFKAYHRNDLPSVELKGVDNETVYETQETATD
jgi:hypothetical protein